MKQCKRCLLSEKRINIQFDSDLVCNYCHSYDKYQHRLNDYATLNPLFQDRIAQFKGCSEFDCLVGLSGGKDSSFVAYTMIRTYGLNPLLVTYDNGFLTDYARKNIDTLVRELGKKHVLLELDPPILKSIYRSSMKRFGIPCIGCTFSGMAMMVKLAIEKDIPFIVHGRTHAQMFRGLTEGALDPLFKTIWSNFKPYRHESNMKLAYQTIKRLRRLVMSLADDSALRPEFKRLFYPDLSKLAAMKRAPELVGLFIYEKYDEAKIMNELERVLQWRKPDSSEMLGHHDCDLHEAAIYFYDQISGQSMLSEELSVMIREGDISREKAVERLAREKALVSLSADSVKALSSISGLTETQLLQIMRRTRTKYNLIKWLVKARFAFLPRPKLPIY